MEELPPGSKVRFRVCDPELGCGASWAVETSRTDGDVYVFHREGARWLKTSLHKSGQWHYGLTTAGKALLSDEQRYFGITKERAQVAPGWLRAKVIVVAHSELRNGYTEAVPDKQTVDIPVDRSADATSINILLKEPHASRLRINNAFPIAIMRRGDGGQACIYATPLTLPEHIHNSLAEPIAAAKSDLRSLGWDGTTLTRIAINGLNDAGHLEEFDIAIDPDTPGTTEPG